MKLSASFAFVVAATSSYAADRLPQVKFTHADPALVQSACPVGYGPGSTCWRGHLKLVGLLVAEFDRVPGSAEQTDVEGQAFFEPNTEFRRKLPEALSYYPAQPSVLWLTKSPRAILVPLMGIARANLALRGKAARYEWPAEIVLTELTTSIDCDHRNYGMSYSAIRLLRSDVLVQAQNKDMGC